MVQAAKNKIFHEAENQGLSEEQKNLIYGKAGLALSLRLKSFMEATNTRLSWNVTDLGDPRNQYKQCPNCNAIFNKTEGCNGTTTCGAVPGDTKRPRSKLIAEFKAVEKGWIVQYWSLREITSLKRIRIVKYFSTTFVPR